MLHCSPEAMRYDNRKKNAPRALAPVLSPLAIDQWSEKPALAWGCFGHMIMSRLTEQRLTDLTEAGIAALLVEPESWADALRYAEGAPSHQRASSWRN
jgi:hypothetical protein